MSKRNNIALKTLEVVKRDRKKATVSTPTNLIEHKRNNSVIPIAGYLKRVATPFFGGFAS